MESVTNFYFSVNVSSKRHLPHDVQLHLVAVVGRLELFHPLGQVVVLLLLPLPQLAAPQPGLAMSGGKPQPQQLDATLNSWQVIKGDGAPVKYSQAKRRGNDLYSRKQIGYRIMLGISLADIVIHSVFSVH